MRSQREDDGVGSAHDGPRRHQVRAIGLTVAGIAALTLLAACSSGPSTAGSPPVAKKADRVITAPAGLEAGAEPQPSGFMWVLAGTGAVKTIDQLTLGSDNAGKVQRILPASLSASTVSESSSGLVALGLATSSTGAVLFLNGSTGAQIGTTALGAPVLDLVAGTDGSTFYALNGTSTSMSVSVISSLNDQVTSTVPVPLDTVSIAIQPNQQNILALEPTGWLSEIGVSGGRVIAQFPVGKGARTIALSNDGSTVYVLKDVAGSSNVGVIDAATERQVKALPAPANTVDIQVSLDGSLVYDLVGTPKYGNIQMFATGRQ
jgi:DNA-binding beta-propeller fold protein YncE